MARSRFRPDRGLSVRMGLTMVLLALLYVVLIVAIGYFTNALWLGIVIGLGVLWAQWYFSDKLALSAMRAREVSPTEAPQLHAIVDRLCALANMPKPRVAISDTELPNAFAAGRSPDRAVRLCHHGADAPPRRARARGGACPMSSRTWRIATSPS